MEVNMLDDRHGNGWGAAAAHDDGNSDPVDRYIEQHLEYLEGLHPQPPTIDHLTTEQRSEAHDMLTLLDQLWNTERQPAITTMQADDPEPAVPFDVLVYHHSADRGWADWISLELENVGYRCWPAAIDWTSGRVDASRRAARPHVREIRVIAVVSSLLTTCYMGDPDTSAIPFRLGGAPDPSQFLAVTVENCATDGLCHRVAPSCWLDLTGRSEPAARHALLERFIGRLPAKHEVAQPPRSASAVELLVQRLGGEIARLAADVGRWVGAALDEHVGGDPERCGVSGQTRQPGAAASLDDAWLPPVLRTTLWERLGPEGCLDLVEGLTDLASVKARLGNLTQAREVTQHARIIRTLFDQHDEHAQPQTPRLQVRGSTPCPTQRSPLRDHVVRCC
jgi:hypothetical protein